MNRRYVVVAVQAVVTVALLALLFRGFDWQAFSGLLARLPWWFHGVSFATVLIGQLLYAVRWHVALRSLGVRVRAVASANMFLIGVFFNNFLPSTMGGDSAKVYYIGRTDGYVRAGASVLIDRVIGLFFVASVALLFTLGAGADPGGLKLAKAAVTLIWAGLGAVLIAVAAAPAGFWLGGLSRWWPAAAPGVERITRLLGYVQDALRRPRLLMVSGSLVAVFFALLGLLYQEFFRLAAVAPPALLPLIGAVAAIATLSNVPIAINGLGLREQLHLAVLGGFGLEAEAAASISLLLFAHLLLVSAIGAVCWLYTSRRDAGALS